MVTLGFVNAWGLWLSAYIRIWFSVDPLFGLVITPYNISACLPVVKAPPQIFHILVFFYLVFAVRAF